MRQTLTISFEQVCLKALMFKLCSFYFLWRNACQFEDFISFIPFIMNRLFIVVKLDHEQNKYTDAWGSQNSQDYSAHSVEITATILLCKDNKHNFGNYSATNLPI